jgi:hypothetical protein
MPFAHWFEAPSAAEPTSLRPCRAANTMASRRLPSRSPGRCSRRRPRGAIPLGSHFAPERQPQLRLSSRAAREGWLARALRLPVVLAVDIGGHPFPIVWSILGGALLVAFLHFRGRRSSYGRWLPR